MPPPVELSELREAGCDIDGLGWDQGELDRLLAGYGDLPASAAGREYDESVADEVEMTECPECGHQFPK